MHGEFQENIYVHQPIRFIKEGREGQVYKLRKALYRLHELGTVRLEHTLQKNSLCINEHTLFTKQVRGNILIVSLYGDDIIFTGNNRTICEEFKHSMQLEFDMTDFGKMRHFLGIKVIQNEAGIFICQRRYAREILACFDMMNSNHV